MSMQSSSLTDLEAQHRALEAQISEEQSHPGGSGFKLTELKRQKLQLKDMMERLRIGAGISVH